MWWKERKNRIKNSCRLNIICPSILLNPPTKIHIITDTCINADIYLSSPLRNIPPPTHSKKFYATFSGVYLYTYHHDTLSMLLVLCLKWVIECFTFDLCLDACMHVQEPFYIPRWPRAVCSWLLHFLFDDDGEREPITFSAKTRHIYSIVVFYVPNTVHSLTHYGSCQRKMWWKH